MEGEGNVPRRGPALLVANHVSFLDPTILVVVLYRVGRRARFFAHETVFRMRLRGWLRRTSRQIPVYRGPGTELRPSGCARHWTRGRSSWCTRRAGPRAGGVPAKPGAGLVALRCDVPVIPVAMWGMHRRARSKLGRFGRAAVRFGPPVDPSAWGGRDDEAAQQEVADALMEQVRAMLPGVRDLAGRR